MSAICNPSAIPLGKQLLKYYFGENQEEALKYDPSLLVKGYKGPHRHILFDQVCRKRLRKLGLVSPF